MLVVLLLQAPTLGKEMKGMAGYRRSQDGLKPCLNFIERYNFLVQQ